GRVEIVVNTENTEGFANTENTEGSAGVGYERTRVTLRVYDMLGRERALLFDGPLNARSVLLTITPATLGLEPGSYMLRLTGGEVFAVRRFSVVR
ncbi:MAG TPA: T9SS type A sorting domain-containing protein, partial [Bacteroidota bacterium]|nr:T9SS type A sorting domain-containing protein [Bacteroidota bacterium]